MIMNDVGISPGGSTEFKHNPLTDKAVKGFFIGIELTLNGVLHSPLPAHGAPNL